MSRTFKYAEAVALAGLLAGCGGGVAQMYYAGGAPPTQTAEAAYWDCTGQSWNHAAGNLVTWIPVPVAQAQSAHDTMEYLNYCMYQKGWIPKPHLELSTGTWVPYQPPR